MATLVICFSAGCLCLYLVVILFKFFNKIWWTPIRIQSFMKSQGIKGPSYRLLYGNTKEILEMFNALKTHSHQYLPHNAFSRILPHAYTWIKLYGMNFLYWYGPQPHLMITEPELVKEVLTNKDGAYQKLPVESHVKRLLGDGLVTSGGEKWTKMRKLANQAFHGECLKGMIPAMIASVEMMLERWNKLEGKEIDAFLEFKVLTSEVISRTAFGSSYLEGQHIFDMILRMIHIIHRNDYKIRIPLIGKFIKTRDDIESENLEKSIRESIIRMMKKREEEAASGTLDSYGKDFFGLLLKAYHDPDKTKKISLEDLIDECKTIYVAGQETTTSLLSWTLLLLSIYKDWQDKARQEVSELIGGERNPSPDSIAKLKTMSMIINESLRLYSPSNYLVRKIGKEVRLGKLILPANMEVYISTLAHHHNSEIWGNDVHHFKPERFAEGVAKATNNSAAAFLPFGMGPRTCVGFNYAIIEAKIALSMILQRYRFTLSPNYVHYPVHLLTMCPKHGVQVVLQPL